jgi:hypothetical protein
MESEMLKLGQVFRTVQMSKSFVVYQNAALEANNAENQDQEVEIKA